MKVTLEIEIEDAAIQRLDYYENYGDVNSPDAGCKKCFFRPICNYLAEKSANELASYKVDFLFPCWNSHRDRRVVMDRGVFVLKKKETQNK